MTAAASAFSEAGRSEASTAAASASSMRAFTASSCSLAIAASSGSIIAGSPSEKSVEAARMRCAGSGEPSVSDPSAVEMSLRMEFLMRTLVRSPAGAVPTSAPVSGSSSVTGSLPRPMNTLSSPLRQ